MCGQPVAALGAEPLLVGAERQVHERARIVAWAVAGIVRTRSLLPDAVRRRMAACARRVVFVVYPGMTALDLVGPHEVFTAGGRGRPPHGRGARRLSGRGGGGRGRPAADDSRRWWSSPTARWRRSAARSTRSSSSAAKVRAAPPSDRELVGWVARAARRSRRVASVCTGAFVLAAAGVLDGRRATTHWRSCDDLARRFPSVTVDPDPIFVRDGDVWTSAGVTAGMDLALGARRRRPRTRRRAR